MQAFEFGVMDFVSKPFSKERLALALGRVTEREGRAARAGKFSRREKYGKAEVIPINRVLYVEGAGADADAELVLDHGKCELHVKTLEKLHALLPLGFGLRPSVLR